MITAAVIFAETPQANGLKQPGVSPLQRLGGLTLLERAMLTAERAGARICYVVGVPNPEITFCPRATARCQVVFLRDGHDCCLALKTNGVVLVFSVDVAFSVTLAQALDACLMRTNVPSVHVPGVPLAVVHAGPLTPRSWDRWRAPEQNFGSLAFAPDGYFVRRLGPTVSTAAVEKALLASLANPQDGLLDRYLNRPLSRWLTRYLAPLPLRANHVTLLSIAVGLAAALLFAADGYTLPVLGALVLQAAAVLDCCDGELARLRFEESPLGQWLDIAGDTLVHLAVFVGIAWGVAASGHGRLPLLAGAVLVAGVVPSFTFVTYAERHNVARRASDLWEGRTVAWMLVVLSGRDFSGLVLLFALLGALRWFLWGAALGVHIFWLTLVWLLWRVREKQWNRGREW
jgi:phosphatidylglycerophosphate synthase